MRGAILAHLRHHARFYAGVLIGGFAYLLMPMLPAPIRLIAAGDIFFFVFLVMMAIAMASFTATDLCDRAAAEDEGIFLVLIIVLAVIVLCGAAIVTVLHEKHGTSTLELALTIAGAPLGWLTLHTIAASHYANLYYQRDDNNPSESVRGLIFPHTAQPGISEFLYYSFVVGMTAQVSDVQVVDSQMRRATLGHSVVSFFFNTGIIAMAVNAVVAMAS